MGNIVVRYGRGMAVICTGLTAFWLLVLVVFPNLFLVEQSFRPYLPVEQIGGPNDGYTLSNYLTFLNPSATKSVLFFDLPIHVFVFLQTVFVSCIVTITSFLLCYPMAYYLAKVAKLRAVPTLLMLLLLPLWVSEILRSFAWYIILSYAGPLNGFLGAIGLVKVRWLTGYNGVIIGLVYTNILFMLFPIYNAISTLDINQIEAARDMGARWLQIHRRIIIPHAKPGIASGCVMVFMMSAGAVFVPMLLGSPTSRWFTEVILQWMFESQDWHTGSAYAFLLLIICTIFVSTMMRLFKVGLADIAR
ncbi:ABC transporter permease [Agrobacterium sp. LAD9]|uniref:ABC transporter permease n=1 Tax=Agrobacterium sp. LAD9 TaxID=2055153 RepID=UPI000D1EB167|nr:ABC transporter permease [Agrobacterium sp. LAD9]